VIKEIFFLVFFFLFFYLPNHPTSPKSPFYISRFGTSSLAWRSAGFALSASGQRAVRARLSGALEAGFERCALRSDFRELFVSGR
jgi:hypothetical protein